MENKEQELIEESKAICGAKGMVKWFITEENLKEIIALVREHDKEVLSIAYEQLQQSSSAYDAGCDIIRQILAPPTTEKE